MTPNQFPVLTPAAAASLLSGATVVVDLELVEDPGSLVDLSAVDFASGDWATDHGAYINMAGATATDNAAVSASIVEAITEGVHRAAYTITASKLVVSLNGSAIQSVTPTTSDPYDSVNIALFDHETRLRSLTFYAPVTDAALPALSAL